MFAFAIWNARERTLPAILNDNSLLSTAWYEPSYTVTLKSTTG